MLYILHMSKDMQAAANKENKENIIAERETKPKLIVVLGPTAVGKSDAAVLNRIKKVQPCRWTGKE
jgi:ATP-dependent protease HslVU (ClpYQ) ATPase subunit